ncbi:hypothetical protein [Deinococcus sp.]|uniref:hypothetical protein n=1 Tax=Deinococcus sp. TaxID=47478 RepID=UPI003C7B8628
MPKRFAYLEGQKVRRKEAEKLQAAALEPLETVYIRKETLRAVWRKLHKGRDGNLNELMEDLLHRWLNEQEQKTSDLMGVLSRQKSQSGGE